LPTITRTVREYDPEFEACQPPKSGCTAPDAINYDPEATVNSGCIWGNDYAEETYTKQCPAGQTGTTYLHKAEKNTYTSITSKANANSIRDIDMDIVGQAIANSTGTCTIDEPGESGTLSIARAEYQPPQVIPVSAPAMIRVKILRSSTGGASPVSAVVHILSGSPVSGTLIETLNVFFNDGINCKSQVLTQELPADTYYAKIISIAQTNYTISPGGEYMSINTVGEFSNDVLCL
jgi:hypothetical protein